MPEDTNTKNLDDGMYIEITMGYEGGLLFPVKEGVEILQLFGSAIPITRKYNNPPKVNQKSEYPAFKYTTGASIKEERLEALLEKG